MAAPLEQLYGLTPRDLAGVLWGPVFRRTVQFLAAADHQTPLQTPAGDQVWFITRVGLIGIPEATQTADRLIVRIEDAAGNIIATILEEFPLGAAGTRQQIHTELDVALVGGSQFIRSRGVFSGALSNGLEFSFMGYQLPRGNVSLS